MRSAFLALVLAAGLAAPACAVDVASGPVSLGSTDLVQAGRLSRNGIPQDFAGDEIYPGEVNTTTQYFYSTVTVPFAANALQDVYYDITFDDVGPDLFASAYLNAYDPTDKALNWLGDAGISGNYFGTDVLFFDVVVPQGNTLTLVFNGTLAGLSPTSTANYLVEAFSDSEYDEDFAAAPTAVPEPATWGMMILGFGVVGAGLRRRRTVSTHVRFA